MYRIEKYLEENIDEYGSEGLVLSTAALDLDAEQGEILTGEIGIHSQSGGEVHCAFYSGNYRMQCTTDGFIGAEGSLSYRFDTTGLDVGARVQSELVILSEAGESVVPFSVRVRQPLAATSLGEVRNLFHFANLARTSWQEAVELFYTDAFSLLFLGHDRQYYDLYRGLCANKGNEHNVDEFLTAIHKKQPASYAPKEESLLLRGESEEESITLIKNGWGYTFVSVETRGDFFVPQKQILTEEDFAANQCEVHFQIRQELLHEGSNLAQVVFRFEGGSAVVPVVLNMPVHTERKREARMEQKKLTAELMHWYLSYVTVENRQPDSLAQAEAIIEQMNSGLGRHITGRLYQAHLYLEMGKAGEARWVLSHIKKNVKKETMTEEQYAYYLFLRCMAEEDASFTAGAKERILAAAEKNPALPLPLCLYRRLSAGELAYARAYAAYENCYRHGARSPVMYREAYALLEEDPALLMQLTDFEIDVLRFALRYGLYTEQMAQRVNGLVERKKDITPALLRFLEESFRLLPLDETVAAACTLMIRNGMTGSICFPWYALAVDRQMRIASLYEYYMMSADMETHQLPPRSVLLYFAYQCSLDDLHKTYLYALVVSHREKLQDLFEKYEPAVEAFALQMLEKGVISETLAVLYRYLLRKPEMLQQHLDCFEQIAFVHAVKVTDASIRRVIVLQNRITGEQAYELERGMAYVDCYTDDYVLLLEDENGNRHADKALYTMKKLMTIEKLSLLLDKKSAGEQHTGMLLYRSFVGGLPERDNEHLWAVHRQLARRKEVEAEFSRELNGRLLRLYAEQDRMEELKELLEDYDMAHAGQKERAEIVRLFVSQGRYEEAFSLLFSYGFEEVPPKTLVRLISSKMEQGVEFDERLLALVQETFRQGKYTQEMLSYLVRCFEGSQRQMLEIWKACLQLDVEASPLAERILQVYLFTGSASQDIAEVFSYYLKRRRRESVARRYIKQAAHRYFVKGQEPQKAVFEALEKMLLQGADIDDVSLLSYLQYMAREVTVYTEEQKELLRGLAGDFVIRKQYVPLFAPFVPFIPWLQPFSELTYLEYRTKPGSQVTLHYVLEEGPREPQQEAMQEPLQEVGGGYFCKSIPMFFGERIRYYFMEERQGESVLAESGHLEKSDMSVDGVQSRFAMINDMMMSDTLGDRQTQRDWMKKYVRKALLVEKLFGQKGKTEPEKEIR